MLKPDLNDLLVFGGATIAGVGVWRISMDWFLVYIGALSMILGVARLRKGIGR